MKRESPWNAPGPGKVVHVVGCVTDEVFSFLGPATHTLAASGLEQEVVMIDALRFRHHVASLHESAELVLAPSLRNPLRQWHAVLQACRPALVSAPLHAVHLHGLLPSLVGAWALRSEGVDAPIFYSPHGSRSIGKLRFIGALAWLLVRTALRGSRSAAIVNVPRESQAFEHWKPALLVESPVAEAYFNALRNEARHPLIVSGGRDPGVRSTELFAQLAVLLGGEDLRTSFNWIGSVDEVSRQRLNAANVGVFDVTTDAECASRLAAGWIYLAPGGTRGFPLFLLQAMAARLPCVAFDCPQHREVIRDRETGFLCQTEGEMIDRIATLIDNPALRARLGAAASADARRRFGASEFSAKLRAAYALP